MTSHLVRTLSAAAVAVACAPIVLSSSSGAVATSPAARSVTAAAVAHGSARPALRIMPLGDSITQGQRETIGSYRVELATRLKAAGMTTDFVGSQHAGNGPDVDHEGHSHWTIDMIAAQIDGWLATYRPDVVLLHLGTNNLQDDAHAATAPALLTDLLARIAADRPNTDVFVAKVIASRIPDRNLRTDAYNSQVEAIVAAAGPRFHLVDQSAVGGLDLRDNLHPNAFGYQKMAYTWYHAMEAVFATPEAPWPAGADPFTATKAYLCEALDPRSFTSPSDCRWWAFRPTTRTVDGQIVSERRWQTVRPVPQSFTVPVKGRFTYPVKRVRVNGAWVHRKVKTWVPAHTSTRIRQVPTWVDTSRTGA
jgi:lysophospholipase L1-like esterase